MHQPHSEAVSLLTTFKLLLVGWLGLGAKIDWAKVIYLLYLSFNIEYRLNTPLNCKRLLGVVKLANPEHLRALGQCYCWEEKIEAWANWESDDFLGGKDLLQLLLHTAPVFAAEASPQRYKQINPAWPMLSEWESPEFNKSILLLGRIANLKKTWS